MQIVFSFGGRLRIIHQIYSYLEHTYYNRKNNTMAWGQIFLTLDNMGHEGFVRIPEQVRLLHESITP
jgi:hypothetical protein